MSKKSSAKTFFSVILYIIGVIGMLIGGINLLAMLTGNFVAGVIPGKIYPIDILVVFIYILLGIGFFMLGKKVSPKSNN